MDQRSHTSKENGKKGGRPVSSATLRTQAQREILLELLEEEIAEIFQALVDKAKKGDVASAKEIFDRAYGKATQGLDITGDNFSPLIVKFIGDDRDVDTDRV